MPRWWRRWLRHWRGHDVERLRSRYERFQRLLEHNGRALEDSQVEAIVHLVASSIPELTPGRVTVVDHKGRLLSSKQDSRQMTLSNSQFEYTKELENHFKQRVEEILSPLLGPENLRAEVTAEVDFTVTEQTQENFNGYEDAGITLQIDADLPITELLQKPR